MTSSPSASGYRARGGRFVALLAALIAFLLVGLVGELGLRVHLQAQSEENRMNTVYQAAVVRAKIERELNSVLYLSSGLGSYLIARNNNIPRREIDAILAKLYQSSRHVRNFGVAVGYQLTYVYPILGNERAIGLYYPDFASQWPAMQQSIEKRAPALIGPVDLVQGGKGLIFVVPMYVGERYWGLLSTVIDVEDFIGAIRREVPSESYQFSLRGKDGLGQTGQGIWGDDSLFDLTDSIVQDIEIPGGRWAVAVRSRGSATDETTESMLHAATLAAAIVVAWMLYALIRSRMELAHRVMYDGLTDLPNRRLLEDRAQMAFSRANRSPGQLCALLFFDLDRFKNINDEYGHKAGDIVLRAVADRARSSVRRHDTVARWGGDEFIVLLENIEKDALQAFVDRLRTDLEVEVDYEGSVLYVGVSMGLAIHPDDGETLDDLLKVADQRMYGDKTARRTAELAFEA